jgi:hypothetical protein
VVENLADLDVVAENLADPADQDAVENKIL